MAWFRGRRGVLLRTVRGFALAPLLLVAGGCWYIDDDDDHGTASATTTPECTTECEAGVCEDLACDEDNVCKTEHLPAGSMDDDIRGDCRGLVCDGMGSWQTVITNDPPFDERGDCHLPVCDESGGILLVLDQTDPPSTKGDCQVASCGLDGEVLFEADESDVPNDGNECTIDACSGMTPLATPVAVNTPCSGGYCHPDGVCRPCPTFAECTNEPGEPNDSQAAAYSLGTISDDDADGSYVCASLDGPDDVDWFVYNGEDKPLNVVNPTRQIAASAQARLCVYARCASSGTSVICAGESPDTAPQGQKGCCSFGTVTPTINCDGLDDSATIWIKVENQNALECVEYQLSYHF